MLEDAVPPVDAICGAGLSQSVMLNGIRGLFEGAPNHLSRDETEPPPPEVRIEKLPWWKCLGLIVSPRRRKPAAKKPAAKKKTGPMQSFACASIVATRHV